MGILFSIIIDKELIHLSIFCETKELIQFLEQFFLCLHLFNEFAYCVFTFHTK